MSLSALTIGIILVSFVCAPCFAGAPAWAKEKTQERDGSKLKLVCSGSGSSIDVARKIAQKSCVGSAVDQAATSFHVSTTSIETEQSVALHQQVDANNTVNGLQCSPLEEAIDENGGAFTVWLKCSFDLSKIAVGSESKSIKQPVSNSSLLADSADSPAPSPATAEMGQYILSDKRTLLISASPCDSILVTGKSSRILTCDHSPMKVTVGTEDDSLIIRAAGFKSKTLKLNSDRTRQPAGVEAYEILLDR